MLHVWSNCLLILLSISIFIGSTAMIPSSLSSNENIEVPTNAEVTAMVARTSTYMRNKPKEETLRMMINKHAEVIKQERLTTPKKSGNIVNKCDHGSKVSSKSIPSLKKNASSIKRFQRIGRKLLPREQDMDAFVADADYRGPQRHPPKNN